MNQKKILIIDDDIDLGALYAHFLKKDYHCEVLNDPLQVLGKLCYEHFDLLLTDIIMPELNGIELIKKVRSTFPKIKILVCSEGGSSHGKEIVAKILLDQAKEMGAHQALKKPFTRQELRAAIKECL